MLFLLQSALVGARFWQVRPLFGQARWPEGVLVVLGAATTLGSLTMQLPGQNVMLAAVTIAILAGAVQCLNALTGVPFGPCVYTESFGQLLFYPLPWATPLIWLVFILNARGVARLILQPWRRMPTYGFWLIGLTVPLVVLLDLGLEPLATQVKHYWFWNTTKTALVWYAAPWVNFVSWAVTALLILAFATPSLLNKKPGKQRLVYHPLWTWLVLNTLFATAAWAHQLWSAVGVSTAAGGVVGLLAVCAARWRVSSDH